MTTKLKWRLGKLPSPEEVMKLTNDKIITKDEAREILFTSETDEERDKKSLESEIKFLRDLVDRLSDRSKIISMIHSIQPIYISQPWYHYYGSWCGGCVDTYMTTASVNDGSTFLCANSSTLTAPASQTSSLYCDFDTTTAGNFSEIKTF